MAKDTTCIKKLDDRHYEIRMRYRDPLTDRSKIYKRRVRGRLDEAVRIRDEARVAFREGRHPDEKPTGRRLRHYLQSYWRSMLTRGQRGKAVSKNTVDRHRRALDNHVLPYAGDWIVGQIRRRDVEELVETWTQVKKSNGKPYAQTTINTWLKVLRQLTRHAYTLEELGRSPVEDVQPLAVTETTNSRTCLTVGEAKSLLEVLRTKKDKGDRLEYIFYYPMVLLGLTTGARHSALSALHWEDVDFSRELVRLHHSQNKGIRKVGTKTGKRKTFPLLPELARALQEHRTRLIATEHPAVASGIVFPARIDPGKATHNGYMQRWTLRGVLKKSCADAEVPRITPHDFRAFFNTRLLAAGVHPELVRAMTGHTTEAMTEHYAHIEPADKVTHLAPLMASLTGAQTANASAHGTNSGTSEEA